MPKEPLVAKSDFETVLIERKHQISEDGYKIKPPSNSVWQEIKASINGLYSSKYIYVYVKQNRNNIWSKLGISEKSYNECLNKEDESFNSNEPSSSDSFSNDEDEILKFTVMLTPEEWDCIKPQNVIHYSSTTTRVCQILTPNVWTSIVNDHFWNASSLPCCLAYKRAQVNKFDLPFIKIIGRCSCCLSQFTGKMETEPQEGEQAVISCTYKGSFRNCRNTEKRKLIGSAKEYAEMQICNRNVAPSAFRNLEARKIMNFGDPEPAHLASTNALRILKHRKGKKDLVHENPIISINMMMHGAQFQGCIKSLAYEPFHAIYWTPSQLKLFNMYCKLSTDSKICLDATGSVVKKINRPFGKKSKHIFLYEATVRDDVCEKQYSVSNMLSESQDNIAIGHWLALWKKDGAVIPKEVVCDHSIAIISAAVKNFTQFANLEDYLTNCSQLIFQKPGGKIPDCFIRCDVAHTMKLIASWPALKGKNYIIRNLYIRSLGQILQSTDLNDVQKLLEAIIIVSVSASEGNDVNSGKKTYCENAKLFLKERISSEIRNKNLEELFSLTVRDLHEYEEIVIDSTDNIGYKEQIYDFKLWFQNLAESIKNKVILDQGDHDNAQYLPEVIKNVANLMKTFPLWSGIMIPFFGYGYKTTSSAPVESNFKILKHQTFAEKKLPIRVDIFLEEHLKSLEGQLKLAASTQNGNVIDHLRNQNMITTTNLTTSNIVYDTHMQTTQATQDLNITLTQCSACVNGDLPTGAHKCIKCGIAVHLLPGCSDPLSNHENEGYGEQRLCKKCNAKLPSLDEDQATENWRGLALPLKKRKRSSFLEVNSEIKNLDFSSHKKTKPLGILKNGNANLKPIKFNENYIIITNTCAYDSIIQIFASAFSDSELYQNYANSLSTHDLFKIIRDVAFGTITTKTYSLRANLLTKFCKSSELPNRVLQLKGECTVRDAALNLFREFPSFIEIVQCTKSICTYKNVIKRPLVSIVASNQSIKSLQTLINDYFQRQTTTCSTKVDEEQCNADRITDFEIFGEHFIIEVINEDLSSTNDVLEDIEVRVSDVPNQLQILGKKFHLRGIIAFNCREKTKNSIGHYFALCKRLNDFWELYDDLEKKKTNFSKQKKFPCQCFIYTV